MTDGSGPNSRAPFATLDPDGSWRKTSPAFSLFEEGAPSVKFSETWPTSGTMRAGRCSPLPTSARLTSGKGSGLWPTPTMRDRHSLAKVTRGKNAQPGGTPLAVAVFHTPTASRTGDWTQDGKTGKVRLSLQGQAKLQATREPKPGETSAQYWERMAVEDPVPTPDMGGMTWPTPRAEDSQCAGPHPNRSKPDSLHAAVKIPTPSPNDWKGSSKPGERRRQLTDPAMGAIPVGGQLNPTWVEWLMGFPLGWTALPDSETP